MLAGIWAEVLKLERVGIEENFFELGGHSLLAMQMISRVRTAFEVALPVKAVFESPTVAGLAEQVETTRRAARGNVMPALKAGSRAEALPLSFAQQRLWFLDQMEPGNTAYNIPLSVKLNGALDVEALERTISEVVRRHEILRTRFEARQGEPVQIVENPVRMEIPVTDLSMLQEVERARQASQMLEAEAREGFDLGRGPLLRVKLLRMGEEEHIVLMTMHHIVCDGWSMGVLVKEVATLYQAYNQGKESPLAELPLQYGDYAVWQREWLQGEVLEEQLEYWKQHLSGAPPVLELPTARPRPAVQSYHGSLQSIALPKGLSEQLKALSRRQEVTPFMLLLAAFQTLLHHCTMEEDIIVGAGIANRHLLETEKLIGMFVNTLALRTNFGGAPTFREVLARVRETVLNAHAHQDLPFEMVVEALQVERDPSYTPVFQILFQLDNGQLDNGRTEALKVDGLQIIPLSGDKTTAKFDMSVFVRENAEGLNVTAEYNTDLFDAEAIADLLAYYRVLLEGIVENIDRRAISIPIFKTEEAEATV
jgi:acyl carrier protein